MIIIHIYIDIILTNIIYNIFSFDFIDTISHRLHIVPTAYSFESHEAVLVKYDEWKYNEPAQVKH